MVFTLLLWVVSASWLARFPTGFPGARYLFATVPLLAAFAAPVLQRIGLRVRWPLAIASVALTYLAVQAGHIADQAALVYAAKTFVSGSGLPVLFKETLPGWLGIETLHTALRRPEVTGSDLLGMLATPAGWRLVLNQAFVVVVAAGVFAAVAAVLVRLWSRPVRVVLVAAAPEALVR